MKFSIVSRLQLRGMTLSQLRLDANDPVRDAGNTLCRTHGLVAIFTASCQAEGPAKDSGFRVAIATSEATPEPSPKRAPLHPRQPPKAGNALPRPSTTIKSTPDAQDSPGVPDRTAMRYPKMKAHDGMMPDQATTPRVSGRFHQAFGERRNLNVDQGQIVVERRHVIRIGQLEHGDMGAGRADQAW
jgi:hypothetical protein